jgi:hypothetical protein
VHWAEASVDALDSGEVGSALSAEIEAESAKDAAAIGSKTPILALKEWQQKRPELFVKRVYDQTGLDTYAATAAYVR